MSDGQVALTFVGIVLGVFALVVLGVTSTEWAPWLRDTLDRDQRAYRRLVRARAGQYMRLGVSPDHAYARAEHELEQEALDVFRLPA